MRKSQIIGTALSIIFASVIGTCYSIARGPDFDISLTRRVPSKLSVDYLDQAIHLIRQWPSWYFTCVGVDEVNQNGTPLPKASQKLEKGAYFRFTEHSIRGYHDQYQITVQVTDYVPKQKLTMHVVSDSKNRLTRLFDSLDWTIELKPRDSGSWIVGKALAKTGSWRSRLFGKIAPEILLNQVYYPNLFVLAEINNPDAVAPNPEDEHGGM